MFNLKGANRFSSDIAMMFGKRPSLVVRIIWSFVIPAFILGILATTIVTYKTPSVGDYEFPMHATIVGYIFAFVPVSLIFMVIFYMIFKYRRSLRKNIPRLLKPASSWLPNDVKARRIYRNSPYTYESGFFQRFLVNIIGVNTKD